MLGKRDPQRQLFRPDHQYLDHVGPNTFYGFLAREGARLFRDGDFADMYGDRGRPSVPPSQLGILLLQQAKENVSDQEAVDRTAFDLRWKVALGVDLEEKLCAKSTLQLFRANLLLNERYLRLFEASIAACRRQGLGASKKIEVAIDSTPVFGRGAVKDTFNLVSDGIRLVVGAACDLKGWDLDEMVSDQGLGRHFGSSLKGESDLNWSDKQERRSLLAQLVADAHIALHLGSRALRGYALDSPDTKDLRDARALLARLLAQDIDEAPEDGEGPQIRRGTAKDRVISSTDPEMRHGHKSHSKGFDGYKASIVVDTEDGVILSTGVDAGNAADRENAVGLVEAAGESSKAKVETVLGDTAYGDLGTRDSIEELGAEVVAKAPPIASKKGTFKRDAFTVDEQRGTAKCPAGNRSKRRSKAQEGDGFTYHFDRDDCSSCPLREQCTTSATGPRTITVTEDSKRLDKLRRHQKTKSFRRRYRRRVIVEHAFGRLRRHGIRQAKYFGARKTAMQVALAAMAANIGLAAVCKHFGHLMRALRDLAILRTQALPGRSSRFHRLPGRSPRFRPLPGRLQIALCRPDL